MDSKGSLKRVISLSSLADLYYATPDGYVAIRITLHGSWLIQDLCNQLESNQTDDFLSVLITTSRKVAIRVVVQTKLKRSKQMPTVVSPLIKKIHFHSTNE